MPDTKITALTAIGANPIIPSTFPIPMVDLTDTSMAASGTTKKVTVNQILGAGGTATLASATISGALDAARLNVTGATIPANGVYLGSANNLSFSAASTLGMTLNSTGLGVGTSPVEKLTIAGRGLFVTANPDNAAIKLEASTGTNAVAINFRNTGGNYFVGVDNSAGGRLFGVPYSLCVGSEGAYPVVIATNNIARLTVDTTGNVGIGVTPSAWAAGTSVIDLNTGGNAGALSSSGTLSIANNGFFNGTDWKYKNTSTALLYQLISGTHCWFTAASGTAGTTITDFATAKMTLDASGNLLVGTTSALFNSRLRVKTSSTSASDYGVYVADSADALIFALRNDGLIYTGTKTASPYNNTTGSAANAFIAADGTLGRSTSSLKYKTDITDSTRGLADVLKLRPVTYKSKNGDDTIFGGLIAEEVHAAGLTEFVAYAPDNAPDAIHYSNMVSLLVAAIKELTAEVNALKNA